MAQSAPASNEIRVRPTLESTSPARTSAASSILAELLRNIPENDAMLAGYRFCARETIRFLIEDEHLSPDDPVIVELMNHLVEQQNRLPPDDSGGGAGNVSNAHAPDSAGNSPCHSEDEAEQEDVQQRNFGAIVAHNRSSQRVSNDHRR